MLKLLIGLQKAESGSIRILGQEIGGLAVDPLNEIRKKIGFLFQSAALYDSLTIEQNVAFPISRHRPETVRRAEKDVRAWPTKCGRDQAPRFGALLFNGTRWETTPW